MLDVNNLFHATRIVEGYGVIETTGQERKNLGFQKVVVITDPFLASSEHYEKLKDENNQEIVGTTSNCRSVNVCRQVAYNNAITTYASLAASYVKGRTASDVNLNSSDKYVTSEFDNFYAAYERVIGSEIKNGVLKESYSIKRKKGDINEYQIVFFVNEDKALLARKKAMQRALEESQLAQKYANEISKFVNEGVENINQ